MSVEFAFDRIATVYDAQRALLPAMAAQIGRAIVALTGRGAPILDLGVGTGRVAMPVVAAGGFVVGLDRSAEMLAVAAERAAPADLALELVRGDAQALPFADGAFRAVIAVHILHLLPDWRDALAEVVRVVGPGGMLVQGSDWRDPDSCVGLLRGRLRLAALALEPGSRPPGAGAAITQVLARYGGVCAEPVIAARWSRPVSPAEVIAGMAARLDCETWALSDDLLAAAVAQVQTWAESRWDDLGQPEEVEHRFVLTTTHFAGETVSVSSS